MKSYVSYIIGLLLLIVATIPANAQRKSSGYTTAGGIRLGFYPGLTVKHKIKTDAAIEGILSSRYNGLIITGLYEIQAPAFTSSGIKNFEWFYGIGAHVGSFGTGKYRKRNGMFYNTHTVSLGVDLILGIEYRIEEIPFLIGLDVKPFFDIINPGYGYWDNAISIRYILK